jgi:hypothetical protein
VLISWDLVWFKIRQKIFKKEKKPLIGLTGQFGVHRALHCALSGAPVERAQIPFVLCAVRCAPDRHYRLSCAHNVFLKNLSPPEPEARQSFSADSLSALAPSPLWRSPLPLGSPTAITGSRAPVTSSSLGASGEQPCASPLLFLLSPVCSVLHGDPLQVSSSLGRVSPPLLSISLDT